VINVSAIQGSIYGIVGWRQPDNPDYAIVDSDNLLSGSGYYFTDNPFVKIEYLKDTMDYAEASDAEFNTYLDRLQNTAIANVMNRVFNEADHHEQGVCYPYANNKISTLDLTANTFLGYRIWSPLQKNTVVEISKVFLEFEGTGTIKILLFNSAKKAPIQSKEVSLSDDFIKEVALNWKLDNTSGFYKGEYYLGYLADTAISAGLKPYKRDFDNALLPGCFKDTYFELISAPNVTAEELFDISNLDGLDDPSGLNPYFVVYDDFSDYAIQSKALFGRAIYLQGVINVIEGYFATERSNRGQRLTEQIIADALVQVEGSPENGIVGLKTQLGTEIKQIQKEINKLKEGYLGGELQSYTAL
jgi:hypothetical protein